MTTPFNRLLVLVVEDAESTSSIAADVAGEGFDVRTVSDSASTFAALLDDGPDVVVIDTLLPGMSGIDLCRAVREESDVPIVIVNARDTEADAVLSLEVGADDYVAKPYRHRELVARMRAAARRRVAAGASGLGRPPAAPSGTKVQVGPIMLDRARHEAFVGGHKTHLAPKEFELLAILLERAGAMVSRSELIARVWGRDHVGETKTLDVHIMRLRSKIEIDPSRPEHILTVRGLGFIYDHQTDTSSARAHEVTSP